MSKIIDDLDLKYNPEPVCPYCGHHEPDAWEIDFESNEDTETDCENCGKTYGIERIVTVEYTTYLLPDKEGEDAN